jgi:predicted RNA-binding protein with PIN domain
MKFMPYWFDGNNLIGQPVARADRGTRRAFLDHLSALSRQRGGRFLVFFDGDDQERTAAPPGIQVRYSAPISADEAILIRLAECRAPSEVTVVTNDRALAQHSRTAGARIMTWQEFTSKARAAPAKRRGTGPPDEEKVNVDEWMQYFGLDKKNLK